MEYLHSTAILQSRCSDSINTNNVSIGGFLLKISRLTRPDQALCNQVQRFEITADRDIFHLPGCVSNPIQGEVCRSPNTVTSTICYAVITPNMDNAQIGFNVLSGLGQCGPLTLIVALVQFTAPHAFLSTATGLGFSARAIGGAFGSAVSVVFQSLKCRDREIDA